MTPPYFPPSAAFSAGQAADDDGEKGEDSIENGLANGNDAVHNSHDAASNGIKYRLNLNRQKKKKKKLISTRGENEHKRTRQPVSANRAQTRNLALERESHLHKK
jgi:hypothetical protein